MYGFLAAGQCVPGCPAFGDLVRSVCSTGKRRTAASELGDNRSIVSTGSAVVRLRLQSAVRPLWVKRALLAMLAQQALDVAAASQRRTFRERSDTGLVSCEALDAGR